jgi:hypothetical protein
MLKTLYLILFLSFASATNSQNWIWAKRGCSSPSPAEDVGNSSCTNAYGNIFVTGYFNGSDIYFDSIHLTSPGMVNFYLTKYDSGGHVLWAKNSISGWVEGNAVCADKDGSTYVTGYCMDNSLTIDTMTINAPGYDNVFILKFDPNGNPLWGKLSGPLSGPAYDVSKSICLDVDGNVVVAGWFEGPSIAFDTVILSVPSHANYGNFLVKYDSDGHLIWARNGEGNTPGIFGWAVSSDPYSNIYTSGMFYDTISFGTDTLINGDTTNHYADIFITKYDAAGNALWARSFGGDYEDVPRSLACDGDGNIYMTGGFQSSSISFGSTTLTNGGILDVFTAKFDVSGNVLWAKRAGGTNQDSGNSISVNHAGDVFVSGWFYDPVNIFDGSSLTDNTIQNVFIVKYDGSGNQICASALSCGGFQGDGAVCTDLFGNAYIAGDFKANPLVVGSDSLLPTAHSTVFLVKYRCDPDLTTSLDENFSETDITVYPNPGSGIFTVNLNGCKHPNITLYDALGKCILNTCCLKDNVLELDLTAQPEGIYFLKVVSEGKEIAKKIVLQ